jgi:hypothetical protein
VSVIAPRRRRAGPLTVERALVAALPSVLDQVETFLERDAGDFF